MGSGLKERSDVWHGETWSLLELFFRSDFSHSCEFESKLLCLKMAAEEALKMAIDGVVAAV